MASGLPSGTRPKRLEATDVSLSLIPFDSLVHAIDVSDATDGPTQTEGRQPGESNVLGRTPEAARELAMARRRSLAAAAQIEAQQKPSTVLAISKRKPAFSSAVSKPSPSQAAAAAAAAANAVEVAKNAILEEQAKLSTLSTDLMPVKLKKSRPSERDRNAKRVATRVRATLERMESTEQITYRVSGPGLLAATVRESTHFTIEAFGEDGHRMSKGGEPFSVSIHGVSRARARITDNKNGVYNVEWKPVVSGRYNICISVLGIPVPGSPFALVASTPEPHASRCELRGKALSNVVARETQSFEISFRDKLGATTHAVELDVFVEPMAMGSPRGAASLMEATMLGDRDQPKPASEEISAEPKSAPPLTSSSLPRTVAALAGRSAGSRRDAAPTQKQPCSREPEKAKLHGQRAGGADGRTLGTSIPSSIMGSGETRHRRIRIKVKDKPLVVRIGADLHSEVVGQLLPGAVVTVIEEKISAHNIRGRIALDYMGKEDALGRKTECGSTFRSATGDTYRANATEGISPSPSYRSQISSRQLGSTSSREAPRTAQTGLTDLMMLSSIRSTCGSGDRGSSSVGGAQASQSQAQRPMPPQPQGVPRQLDFSESGTGDSDGSADRNDCSGAPSCSPSHAQPARHGSHARGRENLRVIMEVDAVAPAAAIRPRHVAIGNVLHFI